jgi:hypothetical protein
LFWFTLALRRKIFPKALTSQGRLNRYPESRAWMIASLTPENEQASSGCVMQDGLKVIYVVCGSDFATIPTPIAYRF